MNPTVGNLPNAIASGDFDGDGKTDLAVANFDDGTLTILLGNGSGAFAVASTPRTGSGPEAVVAGDFNGDGKIDLAIANSGTTAVTVLLGNGNGTFSAAASPLAGSGADGIALGDFNGDGNLDLVIANSGSNTLTVLLGRGDGTFAAAASPTTGSGPQSIGVADFDQDGNADVVVLNANDGTFTLLLGKGDGTFKAALSPPIDSITPLSVVVCDVNQDGIPDMLVPGYYVTDQQVPVRIVTAFLGAGDGTFTAISATPGAGNFDINTSQTPTSLAIGDFNGDGIPDMAVARQYDNSIEVWFGNGDGTFFADTTLVTGNGPLGLVEARFGADGGASLAVANSSDGSVSVFLTQLTQTARAEATGISLVGTGTRIVVAEYAGDVTFAPSTSGPSSLLPTTTTLALTSGGLSVTAIVSGTAVSLTASVKAGSVAVSTGQVNFCDAIAPHCTDIHLLGTAQLTAAGTAVLRLSPGVGSHSYKAEFVGSSSALASSSSAHSLAVSGKHPTATSIAQSGDASGYTLTATVSGTGGISSPTGTVSFQDMSNGNSVLASAPLSAVATSLGWTNTQIPASFQNPQAVTVGDFNGDGRPDLVVANFYGSPQGTLGVLLGKGDGTFTTTGVNHALGVGPISIAVSDFDGDGNQDVAVANFDNTVTVLLGKGNGTFKLASSPQTGNTSYPVVVAADFNGDGKPDLAVTNFTDNTLTILLGNGDGTFSAAPSPNAGVQPLFVAAADFNEDGIIDLIVTDYDNNQASPAMILLGNGDGTFTSIPGPSLGGYAPIFSVGDFNNDGHADLAIPIGANSVVTLLGNGDGTFKAGQTLPTGSGPHSVVLGDFNGDGIVDLAVANYNDGNASIFVGNGDGTFSATLASPPLLDEPGSMAAGDFNLDGVPDLVATSSGLPQVAVLLTQISQTATAEVSGIVPVGLGTHLVEASYPGNSIYASSISGSTSLTGQVGPAATPVFSPVAGTYSAVSATITDTVSGAAIYYTTDGTTPTSSSAKYSGPIAVSQTTTLKAIAAATGYTNSKVASATYVIAPAAATPIFSPVGGTYTSAQSVKITDTTAGAVIYYTINGSTPTTSSTKHAGPISVSATETIKAIAVATGYSNSAVASAIYTITPPAATPVISPAAGTYTTAKTITITDTTPGATIYYTTNGTTPTAASTKYSTAFKISATTTVKAIAISTGYANSAVASSTYTLNLPKPTATPVIGPAAGTYTTTKTITITDATAGAVIYYTLNGSTPTTASTKYTAPFKIAATTTVKAIAAASGYTTSAVASSIYTITLPTATPTISPAAGTYATAKTITMADATSGAVIYYTTNGATPTTASTKYTAAITVSATETIKAIAVAPKYTNSAVATAIYTIETPTATPTFSPAAGAYTTAQSVQIASATADAVIYYTTNGDTPTTASTKYGGAITVSASETIKAIAVATGHTTSAVGTSTYTITVGATATPVLSPAPGVYGATQTVTMTDATPGAVITYTTGIGSTATSYTYTGPFTVSSSEYIAYDAIAPGYTRSPALEVFYTIGSVPAPNFSVAAGTYSTTQSVEILDDTPTATIYYTTNGAAPTTSSTKYNGAITVSSNETIKAIATASGVSNSPVSSAAYVIGKVAATPTFSVAPGSYATPQTVAITDVTPGATIYYTVNGSTPTTASTKYTAAITVSATETIKAITVATGYTNSAVGTAAYTIGYPIETVAATESGNGIVTVPVGGESAFAVAASNGSAQNFSSITVSTASGSLPVTVTLCQTDSTTGQCLAAPAQTVTLSSFAPSANASFSVFVSATAAIANNPSNQITVLFKTSSNATVGSVSVEVDTN